MVNTFRFKAFGFLPDRKTDRQANPVRQCRETHWGNERRKVGAWVHQLVSQLHSHIPTFLLHELAEASRTCAHSKRNTNSLPSTSQKHQPYNNWTSREGGQSEFELPIFFYHSLSLEDCDFTFVLHFTFLEIKLIHIYAS